MSHANAYIGLGANLGEMQLTLNHAIDMLGESPGIDAISVSPMYRSDPVDAPGPGYINAVAKLHTRLAPLALLDLLRQIEAHFGRQRHFRNAPRTLDLDLLLYDDLAFSTPTLTVPHPRMHLRAFVLKPLIDLTDNAKRIHGQSLAQWLAACEQQHCVPLD